MREGDSGLRFNVDISLWFAVSSRSDCDVITLTFFWNFSDICQDCERVVARMAVREILLRNANCSERRCSSANRRAVFYSDEET